MPPTPSDASAAGAPAAPPATAADPHLADYLAQVQLDGLDLSDIALEPAPTPATWPWALFLLWLLAVGFVLGFPTTSYYQLSSVGEGLVWVAWAVALGLGAALVRQGIAQWRAGPSRQRTARLPWPLAGATWVVAVFLRLGPSLQRHPLIAMGTGIGGLALLLAFVLPNEAQWQGTSYSGAWFVAVGAAICCGILVGRFIIASGSRQTTPTAPLPPWQWPRWVRWASLALLVAGGALALGGPLLRGDTSLASDFPFATVGLLVGIGGAIWLSRRFDEWEEQLRQTAPSGATAPTAEPIAPTPDAPEPAEFTD